MGKFSIKSLLCMHNSTLNTTLDLDLTCFLICFINLIKSSKNNISKNSYMIIYLTIRPEGNFTFLLSALTFPPRRLAVRKLGMRRMIRWILCVRCYNLCSLTFTVIKEKLQGIQLPYPWHWSKRTLLANQCIFTEGKGSEKIWQKRVKLQI